MVSRTIAATGGGYALTWLITAALALQMPLRRADAVVTATLLSFAVYTVVVIGVYAARTAARAWGGLLLVGILPGIILLLRKCLG